MICIKKGLGFALQGRLGSLWGPIGIHVAFHKHVLCGSRFFQIVFSIFSCGPALPFNGKFVAPLNEKD